MSLVHNLLVHLINSSLITVFFLKEKYSNGPIHFMFNNLLWRPTLNMKIFLVLIHNKLIYILI